MGATVLGPRWMLGRVPVVLLEAIDGELENPERFELAIDATSKPTRFLRRDDPDLLDLVDIRCDERLEETGQLGE